MIRAACRKWFTSFAVVGVAMASPSLRADGPTSAPAPRTVRVAAIGGINDQDFWKRLCDRFEQSAHIKIETVSSGNKDGAAELFQHGGIDLITMQSNEDVIRLVTDGWATDPQPWVQTELVLVGPDDDPAGVRGLPDLATALRKIAATKSPLLVHDNSDMHDVVRGATAANGIELPSETTMFVLDDHQRRVLTIAAERKAYTLIARAPFVSGKLAHAGLSVMVEGDVRLRRPFLAAVANPRRIDGVHLSEAEQLEAFLRAADTQAWITARGLEQADVRPTFFPVMSPTSATTQLSADPGIDIGGDIAHPQRLTLDAMKSMPHEKVKVHNHDGTESTYAGVPLRALLLMAGAPIDTDQLRGQQLRKYLVATGADGYRAVIALAEVDAEFAERGILICDARDGHALDAKEGPLRLMLPDDAKQARCVRQLVRLDIGQAR